MLDTDLLCVGLVAGLGLTVVAAAAAAFTVGRAAPATGGGFLGIWGGTGKDSLAIFIENKFMYKL